jgi:flagellar basal body P-ring formation protein FlgA
MIRKIVVALAVLAAFGAMAAAPACASPDQPRPRLKAEAVVTGDIVRVGDLVEHAGIIADVPIFRAPDLGATGTVSAEAVAEAVRAHALVGLDTAGIEDVEVTRASRTIAPQTIENCIARALSVRYALGKPDDISLDVDGGLSPQHVEPNALGEPRVSRINYDHDSGRFYAMVEIPTGIASHAPLRLSGRANVTVEVAMVARAVERGAVLKDADLVMERRPRAAVERDTITNSAQAIGLAARNDLQPGRPLRSADLMKPELIRRNQQVTLVYEVPGITLTVRGKATEGGAEGDVISVLNEQSKRILQGTVVGPGHVVIYTRSPQLADNVAAAPAGTVGQGR